MSSTPEYQSTLAAARCAARAGRLAHAYLVVGDPRGAAGDWAAELLAGLFCDAPQRPCGACEACRRLARRSHPDVLWVEPRKKSRTIQNEQIREIQDLMLQTSLAGGWKAAVLLQAERLYETAAHQLLKILEEPPPRCLFLLLSAEPEDLPATIVSRCQRVTLGGTDIAADAGLRARVLEIIGARAAPGLLGDLARARRLLELLKTLKAEIADADQAAEASAADETAEASPRGRVNEAREARLEAHYRERRAAVLRWLLLWQRDILLGVAGASGERLSFPEAAAASRAAAAGLTFAQALANIRAVEAMHTWLEQALPEDMVLERGLAGLP